MKLMYTQKDQLGSYMVMARMHNLASNSKTKRHTVQVNKGFQLSRYFFHYYYMYFLSEVHFFSSSCIIPWLVLSPLKRLLSVVSMNNQWFLSCLCFYFQMLSIYTTSLISCLSDFVFVYYGTLDTSYLCNQLQHQSS